MDSDEIVEAFAVAQSVSTFMADCVRYAHENRGALEIEPESETESQWVALLSAYDVVAAVWIVSYDRNSPWATRYGCDVIKGRSLIHPGVAMNAIPVRDASEATRWAAMLSPGENAHSACAFPILLKGEQIH